MPVIPTIQRKISIPGESGNAQGTWGADEPAKAFAQGAHVIGQEANRWNEVIQKQKAEKDKLDLVNLDNEYSKQIRDYAIETKTERQGELAFNITKEAEADLGVKSEEFSKAKVPDHLKDKFNAIAQDRNSHELDSFAVHEMHQRNVHREQTIKNVSDFAAQNITESAKDPIAVQYNLSRAVATLESLDVQPSIINETTARLVSRAIEANITNGDIAEASVYTEHYKKVLDTYGLRDTLTGMVDRKQKELQAKNYDEGAKEIFLNLGNMKPILIDNAVKTNRISWQMGEHFKTQLKSAQDGPSDPMTYFRLYKEIHASAGDSDAMLKTRQNIFSTGGLSFSDKKSMLTMTEGELDKDESKVRELGANYIKNLVMPSQTMITAAKPKEAENYIDAMKNFDQAILTAKKNGEKINSETVNRIAKEVAATHSMTIYDQMDAAKNKMKTDKEKAAQKKAGQPTGQKDKFGFTVGENKVIRGKSYKYIGNDQWQ